MFLACLLDQFALSHGNSIRLASGYTQQECLMVRSVDIRSQNFKQEMTVSIASYYWQRAAHDIVNRGQNSNSCIKPIFGTILLQTAST